MNKLFTNKQILILLLLIIFLPSAAVMADSRPVAIFGNKYTRGLIKHSCFYPHSANYDIAYKDKGKWLAPEKFKDYATVIICRIKYVKQAPWTDNQIKEVEKWVRRGGRLILTDVYAPRSLSGHGRDLSRLEPLIGAKHYGNAREDRRLLAHDSKLGQVLSKNEKENWVSGHPLTQITSAKVIVGTSKSGLITVNNVGKGQVFYFAPLLYHLPRQSEEATTKWMAMMSAAILSANPTKKNTNREAWNPVPLGPDVTQSNVVGKPRTSRKAKPTLQENKAFGIPITLVDKGKAQSIIVLAPNPTKSASKAAKALQKYINKISTAKLPIVRQDKLKAKWNTGNLVAKYKNSDIKNFILVGKSKLADKFHFDFSKLPPEGYTIETKGNVLLIAGRDIGEKNPDGVVRVQNQKGSQWAAYDFLERHLGVRWLWPGKLGTVIPTKKTITIRPVNEQDAPAIAKRRLRNNANRMKWGFNKLNISDKSIVKRWVHGSRPWFHHQRLGASLSLSYGHAYNSYWKKYGKEHPDWFALQPNGMRKQNPHRPRIDVTNEQLIGQVAKNKIKEFKKHQTKQAASISQDDGSAHNIPGMSKKARKLDPPNGHTIRLHYQQGKLRRYFKYVSLTDRYLRYDNKVAKLVTKKFPNRWLGAYAYGFTKYPPLYTKANPNLLIGFVGLSYLNEKHRQNDIKRWNRWAHVAYHLLLRPNAIYFHGAVELPTVAVRKIGKDVRHAYETGMEATDWDGGVGNWATQGLNYYVLAKVMWDPSLSVEKIVDDYCKKGFGPAAQTIHQYFNTIESITNRSAIDKSKDTSKLDIKWAHTTGGFYAAHFTPQVLSKLSQILDRASNLAKDNKKIKKRIDFLKKGLEYTTLVSNLYRAAVNNNKSKGKKLMGKRYKLYRDIMLNHPFAVNTAHGAYKQGTYFKKKFSWKKPKK